MGNCAREKKYLGKKEMRIGVKDSTRMKLKGNNPEFNALKS